MEIVIKIPEDVYTRLFDNGTQDNEIATDDICEMARALRLGTPLPKRHGDLKDADRLLDSFSYEYCRYGDFGYRQAENLIKSSLTLIKADNKSEV